MSPGRAAPVVRCELGEVGVLRLVHQHHYRLLRDPNSKHKQQTAKARGGPKQRLDCATVYVVAIARPPVATKRADFAEARAL
eukprot:9502563-Pyramimonas_sp.AAC.1